MKGSVKPQDIDGCGEFLLEHPFTHERSEIYAYSFEFSHFLLSCMHVYVHIGHSRFNHALGVFNFSLFHAFSLVYTQKTFNKMNGLKTYSIF